MPKLLTQGVSLEPKNGRQLIGIVAGFKSERWPVIDRNAGRLQLGIRISTSTAFINFGAFTAFFAVNAAVIALLTRNSAERKGRLALMIVAIFGAAFCGSLFLSLDRLALELGLSWFAIGIVYLLAKTRVLKRPLPRLATDI